VELEWSARRTVLDGLKGAVGLTPMVRLSRITPSSGAEVLAKLEYMNPSGSLKDRILFPMVEAAEARGDLRPGMSIIEGTTGNTGIATAMVGAIKGYPVTIVMPRGMSAERKKTIEAYGASLVFTEGGESDVDLVLMKVEEIMREHPGRFWEVGQFSNRDNAGAHYMTTGPEIWEQAGGKIDLFVASAGSGGTVSGVGRFLKERDPGVKVLAVEPEECAILSGGDLGSHSVEGIGDGFIPDVMDLDVLDGVVQVSSKEALEVSRSLARLEGIFAGISSGCNVAACLKAARRFPEARTIVTVINDNGLRYLSTELCGGPGLAGIPARERQVRPQDAKKLEGRALEVISGPLGL